MVALSSEQDLILGFKFSLISLYSDTPICRCQAAKNHQLETRIQMWVLNPAIDCPQGGLSLFFPAFSKVKNFHLQPFLHWTLHQIWLFKIRQRGPISMAWFPLPRLYIDSRTICCPLHLRHCKHLTCVSCPFQIPLFHNIWWPYSIQIYVHQCQPWSVFFLQIMRSFLPQLKISKGGCKQSNARARTCHRLEWITQPLHNLILSELSHRETLRF